jgi:hypothetical protein
MNTHQRIVFFFAAILTFLYFTIPATAQVQTESLVMFSTRTGVLGVLLLFDYPALYWMLCRYVLKFRAQHLLILILESITLFLIALLFFQLTNGSSVIAIALGIYFMIRIWFELEKVQEAKTAADAAAKQHYIKVILPYTRPLLQLLSRYEPNTYPPPINRRVASVITEYAKLICDHERANRRSPDTRPDFELLRYYSNPYNNPFSESRFPASWDSEKTLNFCEVVLAILEKLVCVAHLNLEENTKYEAQLAAVFKASSEDALTYSPWLKPGDSGINNLRWPKPG